MRSRSRLKSKSKWWKVRKTLWREDSKYCSNHSQYWKQQSSQLNKFTWMQQETKNTSFLSNTNVTQNENSSLLQPLPRELNPQIEGKSMTQYVRKFLMKGKVKNPEQILKEKVEGKQIILDNPIRGLLSQRQLHAPSRRATISAKTRRDLQLFSPSHLHFTTLQRFVFIFSSFSTFSNFFEYLSWFRSSYEAYEPLHQLWKDYMTDLLTNANEMDIKNKLLKADYHGALFRGE